MYACYRSAQTPFIGEQCVNGADVQPDGQVEKYSLFESQNWKSKANPPNEYNLVMP